MPSDWLPVPHYEQSQDGRCLPACARMVLTYLGQDVGEDHLAHLLRTRPFGTPADNIRLLSASGWIVTFDRGTEFDLRRCLDQGLPCIVFVKTEALPHWQAEDAHAVVLVGLSGETAYVNDPAFESAPQAVPLEHFLLAWSEFDYEYAVIRRA